MGLCFVTLFSSLRSSSRFNSSDFQSEIIDQGFCSSFFRLVISLQLSLESNLLEVWFTFSFAKFFSSFKQKIIEKVLRISNKYIFAYSIEFTSTLVYLKNFTRNLLIRFQSFNSEINPIILRRWMFLNYQSTHRTK